MNAFPWYGGKASHLNWLLKLLPKTHTFVDVFGGSVAVLLSRYPSPVEVFNDLDSEVVNFFKVLRTQYEELVFQLCYTPYSRQEMINCLAPTGTDLERARRFFVRVLQGATGKPTQTIGDWGVSIHISDKNRYASKYAPRSYYKKVNELENIVERLRNVQIENMDWRYIINRYDTEQTLFYCDPPYLPDSRNSKNDYRHEMSEQDHIDLAGKLKGIEGLAAVSGYDSELYRELYRGWGMSKEKSKKLSGSIRGDAGKRQECLWMNYTGNFDLLPIFGGLK